MEATSILSTAQPTLLNYNMCDIHFSLDLLWCFKKYIESLQPFKHPLQAVAELCQGRVKLEQAG